MDQHPPTAPAGPDPAGPLATLRHRFGRIGAINEANAVLSWDQSAMMPDGGSAARGEQMATLAGLAHELLAADDTVALLDRAADDDATSSDDERRNLDLMRRRVRRARALPAALVERRALLENRCEHLWRAARAASDFARVAPALDALVALVREEADRLGQALGLAPYDALMDGFQPGLRAADVAPVFATYERFLAEILPLAEARERSLPAPIPLPVPVAADRQEALCRALAAEAGLDFRHARLDRSLHPFCGGTPDDVRITTRYDEADPSRALLGVLHETGHALYERHLPAEWRRLPLGEAAGMAVHESQSLIVEMQACRSDPYLAFLAARLRDAFGPPDHPAYDAANLARLWRRVGRSFIRVDADEVTYPAHVAMRFRLEQRLVDGSLAVADLQEAWSDALHAVLGIRPPDDRAGCLQDIHWYVGLFGYFPSYSLGAMAAAQLMRTARAAIPDLDASLATGTIAPLVAWLARHVHAEGQRHGFDDLLRRATGESLNPAHFLDHLRRRYAGAAPPIA